MSQKLPIENFRWKKNTSKFDKNSIKTFDKNSNKRYIFEIDVE